MVANFTNLYNSLELPKLISLVGGWWGQNIARAFTRCMMKKKKKLTRCHTFPKIISLKMNVILQLEFKLLPKVLGEFHQQMKNSLESFCTSNLNSFLLYIRKWGYSIKGVIHVNEISLLKTFRGVVIQQWRKYNFSWIIKLILCH